MSRKHYDGNGYFLKVDGETRLMRSWTKREWVVTLVLIVVGLVGARLFPAFWDNVVVSIAAAAFVGMIVVGIWRGPRQARQEETLKETRRQEARKRFREESEDR